jgi:hypothetical protein
MGISEMNSHDIAEYPLLTIKPRMKTRNARTVKERTRMSENIALSVSSDFDRPENISAPLELVFV